MKNRTLKELLDSPMATNNQIEAVLDYITKHQNTMIDSLPSRLQFANIGRLLCYAGFEMQREVLATCKHERILVEEYPGQHKLKQVCSLCGAHREMVDIVISNDDCNYRGFNMGYENPLRKWSNWHFDTN